MQSVPWHVLHVISNHERRVSQRLAVRSIDHYLPLYTERVKWTDRMVAAERPLFAGYVFAHLPAETRRTVVSIPGVLRVLGDEQRDLVSDEELEKIREGLEGGLLLRPHSGVPIGTHVRVLDGLFAGFQGVVTEIRHQCKVIISLSGFRQCFSLEVPLSDLEVMNSNARALQQSSYGTQDVLRSSLYS